MLDALRGGDQGRIDDGARSFRLENFPALLDQALHCLAFLAGELPSQTLTGLVQSFDVPPRFIQMIGDRFLETGRRSLLGHLRQRLDELRFGAMEVLELIFEQLGESGHFHGGIPSMGADGIKVSNERSMGDGPSKFATARVIEPGVVRCESRTKRVARCVWASIQG